MKALKIILGIVVALVVIYLLLCLAGPKDLDVTRSAEISAPPAMVYQNISDLKQWEHWSPWAKMDTTMQIQYGEKTEGIGASYSWTSENMGGGNLEVIEADPPNSMKTKLQFSNWDGSSYGHWTLEELEGCTTKVDWGISGDQPLPFIARGFMLLMGMKKTMAKDFDDGLAALKSHAEEQVANLPTTYRGFEVKQEDFAGKTYAAVRQTISWDQMQSFFGQNFGAIMVALQANNLQPTGAPSGLYYSWDEENQQTDMAAAIPTSGQADFGEQVTTIEVPAGKALVIDYYGGYSGSGEAHYAMEDYIKARCLEMREPVVEEYVTDPGSEPDSTKWLTRIYYLYK
ncbi:MAG: SRPBCC family protein [Saprospiraceae bacterium]|nr:SRPBCC family protein [Saprospiraceae bacterium]MCB0624138.1 SRPBCC family protein [Saprospiraceae bacterium]